MATWKKIIVSGSNANLASLQVDNLINGVVTGSANGTLGIAPINGTGNIVATTGATGVSMTGSFSGSFKGDGTNLTGVTATPVFPTTAKTDLVSTDKFFVNDDAGDATSGNKKITYGDLLVDLAGTNLATQSNDSLTLATTITGITSISSTSFTGSLFGTSSWAQNAVTASYVSSSGISGTVASASFASTASYVVTAQTASFVAGANVSGTVTSASYAATASYVVTAQTASYVSAANVSGTVTSASYAATASYVVTAQTASFVAGANVSGTVTSASYALTSSFASTAATATTATTATQVANALTFGTGLSGSVATYNGSAAVNVAISGSATLSANNVPKWTGTGFQNSNITDTGAQVQIGATATNGLSVAAGGINVTGNSQFNNNLIISGDLSVNGTTTFINTTNTYIKDQFVLIASGSTTLVDAGIVAQYNAAGSGSTFYLDNVGTYGRWAVAYDVIGTATAVTADEYLVTTKISANTAPSAAPTWGGSGNGSGNMWIKSDTGDIYIYA